MSEPGAEATATAGPRTSVPGGEISPRLITFHLPQYHPIPENDRWWGKGFTEWTNVAKARPQFTGHPQPHLPADLGFYDLRLPEARAAQAELAREYGIHGFCYYHYWFGGRRLLERPVDEILASGEPDFPFCLCWANEPWSRRWDGHDRDVLMPQTYSPEDDLAHIRWLSQAFADPRYIRVDGKPLFLVYRANQLPDPGATADRWREECQRLGIGEIFLARVESFAQEEPATTPGQLGFDAGVEFAPQWDRMGARLNHNGRRVRLRRALGLHEEGYDRHFVYSYEVLMRLAVDRQLPPYRLFRSATPNWDNSARKARDAAIFMGSTPELYERWLRALIDQAASRSPRDPVVFINAWNEWAEGNHLEPCQKWGRSYLEATRRAAASHLPAGLPATGLRS